MEISYDCYAEHGLAGTGIKTVMDACGMSKASIYTYFDSIDDLILQSTAHFMIETELAYMRLAPKKIEDVDKFIDETPYWASKKYGKNIDSCTKYIHIPNMLIMVRNSLMV